MSSDTYDYVVIGSGFGGSVSALRLVEKGYRVLVLERGKRFRDTDFAVSNWNVRKYLWAPKLRCFGILEITPFRDVVALHGAGVGGGSLCYASVLMEPDDRLFDAPAWRHLNDWKTVLQPHYATARSMLGVARNPLAWPADHALREIAESMGAGPTFRPVDSGTFFGPAGHEGEEFRDPYFEGQGPARSACRHCGACMVGCRYNAKNTLMKNYLYLAEKWGAEIRAECEVRDVRPLSGQPDGARYEVVFRRSTGFAFHATGRVRARNVIFSAGAIGTLRLLFRLRQVTRSLPRLSSCLGNMVRTNSEELLGVVSRRKDFDFSKGLAITTIFMPDPVTAIEPVRYPAGSSLMRFLGAPMLEKGGPFAHLTRALAIAVTHPVDFLRGYVFAGWAQRTTILLAMQTEDNRLKIRMGRPLLALYRRALLSRPDEEAPAPPRLDVGHRVARAFAEKTDGIALSSVNEAFADVPMTAHFMGGCPFGRSDEDGVVDLDCQIHNYPGLFVIDGSIMPANPGVNPSLTITALAEYAMSRVAAKDGAAVREPIGVRTRPVAVGQMTDDRKAD